MDSNIPTLLSCLHGVYWSNYIFEWHEYALGWLIGIGISQLFSSCITAGRWRSVLQTLKIFPDTKIHISSFLWSRKVSRCVYFTWTLTKLLGKPAFDPCSHRPVTLLSTFSKLLERAVAHTPNYFIHYYHIVPTEQFGFLKHSEVSERVRIIYFITYGFNLQQHTAMFLFDIKKAYATLWLNGFL